MIDREAEHLNRVVTNLLDLSRIEAGALRVDLDPYDLADLVETAFDRLRRRLATRSIGSTSTLRRRSTSIPPCSTRS